MSNEYSDPAAESEMRRRAAWLLGMIVLVAVLVVVLMVLFLKGHGKGATAQTPGSSIPTGPPPRSAAHHPSPGSSPTTPTRSSSSTGVSVPPRVTNHHVSCPTDQPCVARGDVGNAVAAINSYRRQHGQPPVDGTVSTAAQHCALTNGTNCSGAWAESQLPDASGQLAVQKILPFAQLLDPNLSSMEVGWAYDPAAQQYYFALIRDD